MHINYWVLFSATFKSRNDDVLKFLWFRKKMKMNLVFTNSSSLQYRSLIDFGVCFVTPLIIIE